MPITLSAPSIAAETADAFALCAPGDTLALCTPDGAARWAQAPERVEAQLPEPDAVVDSGELAQ